MPDDDTVPVRRETLRVLVNAIAMLHYWHSGILPTWAKAVLDPDEIVEASYGAVREAEAQLRGEEP